MTLGTANTNSGERPERISLDEQPDATVEAVPDDIVEDAVEWCTEYARCPECGEEQFFLKRPGWNTTTECSECDTEVKIVG
jgi:hypothetical protein